MLVTIIKDFYDANGKLMLAGSNPDVLPEVARKWIADGFATDDTDGGLSRPITASPDGSLDPAGAGAVSAAVILGLRGTTRHSKYYDLKHDGSDESTKLQAALDDLYTTFGNHGAVLVLPEGKTTVAQGVIHRPGISIQSESGFSNFTEGASEWWGHRLKLPDIATLPLIMNDTENGYIRQYSNDTPNLPQRYHGGSLKGLALSGSRHVTNHTADCDLVRVRRAWNYKVQNCSAVDARGFGFRIDDCNTLNFFDNNAMFTGGVFMDSVADSEVRGGQFGGGNGLSSCVFWVSGQSQKNRFSNMFIFNNQMNGAGLGYSTRAYAYPMVAATVEIPSDGGGNPHTILFASVPQTTNNLHYWTTGTPVTVRSTGTLPGGLEADKTYFVRRVNDGRIAFATTRERAISGAIVSLTSKGSGTITVECGANTNLYINDGSTKNGFDRIRSDQPFGSALLVGAAPGNAIANVTAQEGSFGNYVGYTPSGQPYPDVAPTPGPMVILRNGSINTSLGGAWSVDGIKTGAFNTPTGFESRQKFGLSVDISSQVGLVVAPTVSCINHTDTNSEAGSANFEQAHINPNRHLFPATQFRNVVGSTETTFGGARRNGWSMGTTADCFIGSALDIPAGWKTVRVKLYWVPSAAGSGNVAWAAQLGGFDAGSSTNAADPVTTADVASPATGQDVLTEVVLGDLDFSSFNGKSVYLRVKHSGTSGLNTFASAPIASHIVFERIS